MLLPALLAAAAVELAPAPTPVDDPLKGLVPYADASGRDAFPHSMEFGYLPLAALMTGPGRFDWKPLDRLLAEVAARGCQTVFRVFVEYPNRAEGLPAFLKEAGVKVTEWKEGEELNRTPDYADPRLRTALREFVAALGARYDHDPRLAYVTAGLLGKWGEWNDWPRDELFAPKAVQQEIMDAYAKAFRRTPILLRYPAGPDDSDYAANVASPFGYHDDSFAHSTLVTGKPDDGWFYMVLVGKAGAEDVWRTRPIGGEIRPEVWGRIFDAKPGPDAQPFDACVRTTHATWTMDSGMFERTPPAARRARAEASVRAMGYAIRARAVAKTGRRVRLTLTNVGVAPFYRPWAAEWGLVKAGRLVARATAKGRIDGLLPGATRVWDERPPFRQGGTLLVRVPNPMPGGHPVGFGNAAYGRDLPGWLSLGPYTP